MLVFVLLAEDLCGIFVKSVIEGSMADRSGCIMVNDQITQVDGTSLAGISNQQAVEILKNTGPLVQVKACYFKKVGLVDLSSSNFIFPPWYSSPQGRLS